MCQMVMLFAALAHFVEAAYVVRLCTKAGFKAAHTG
jgi:hypothetical protein